MQERVIELALQAGCLRSIIGSATFTDGQLKRFAELVRADALDEAVNVALSHYDGYQISEDIRSLK